MPRRLAALAAVVALAGCSRTQESAPNARASASAVAPLPSAAAAGSATPSGAVPFIEDDYPKALAEARAKGIPIFVDTWAPWCHTCLSLRAYVLSDPALAVAASRFVWLAIDTEKESNAAFVKKFPMQFWPTLWVIDPEGEKPVVKWPGSLTTPELLVLLDDAALAVKQKSTGGEAGAALLRGDQAAASGKMDDAIRAYRDALSAAPAGWPRRARTVDALATQLASTDAPGCLALGEAEGAKLPPGTNAVNVVVTALGCATKVPRPATGPAPGTSLAEMAEKMAKDRGLAILADDRSGLFEALNEWLGEQGKATEPRRMENARAWAAFLEEQAKAAPTKDARVVFDAHRTSAYFALGDLPKAIAMSTESARDFPGDYNHPARLARDYLETKQLDEALAQVKKALALAYGPRKLKIYEIEARILTAKGDPKGAKQALEAAVKEGETMTLTGSYAKTLASIKARAEKP